MRKIFPGLPGVTRRCQLALLGLIGAAVGAPAMAQGLNAGGSSGGLSIPDARPLGDGLIALGMSNAPEPQLGQRPRPRSYLLGIGLLPGLDFVGRFAEHATRYRDRGWTGGNPTDGISDLSVNAKVSFALGHRDDANGLRLALGLQDVAGTGARFRAAYGVATQPLGLFDFSLGIAKSRAQVYVPGTTPALNGVFGGVSMRVPMGSAAAAVGSLALVAEHDSRQALLGARFTSTPLALLGHARLSAALHRSGADGAGVPAATVLTLGLALPFGDNERRIAGFEPAAPRPAAASNAAEASPAARLSRLKEALVAAGLERVRTGLLADGGWVVSYQNRRFGHNEVDALGVVLGMAAEAAPSELRTLVVVAQKQGQPVLTVRVPAQAWRSFLREGGSGPARAALQVQRGDGLRGIAVDWIAEESSPGTRLQLQLTPEIAYTVGTEYGDFDYSLAARVLASVPLWTGAQVLLSAQQLVSSTPRTAPKYVFNSIRQPEGLQALALHQTVWLDSRAVLGAALGRFEHGALGAEAEAVLFVPGRDDVLRLRGRQVERKPQMLSGADQAGAASYRWIPRPDTWVEVGAQRYSDGSTGPSLVASRWWGDVAVHFFYRRGGDRQFAGLEFSLPLTPRVAPGNEWVQVSGSPSYRRGLRTRITDSNTRMNFIEPRNVRELQLSFDLDVQTLNAGRLGPEYIESQFARMRQAFHLYASAP